AVGRAHRAALRSVSVLITGWQAYESARSALEEVTFQRLTAIRESKRRQIEYYFEQVRSDAINRSGDPEVVAMAKSLIRRFSSLRDRDAMRALLLGSAAQHAPVPLTSAPAGNTLSGNTLSGNTLSGNTLSGNTLSGNYLRDIASADTLFLPYMRQRGYYDIFIVDALSGDIVYTVKREADFATSLRSGPYHRTNIAEVFRSAASARDRSFARFVDFQPYAPSADAPASFVASPVMDGSRAVAVLIFQMSIDDINAVMTEYGNWEREGLGESGETYIVGTDYRMRNDSRFFIEQPEEYTSMLRGLGTPDSVVRAIVTHHTSVLLQDVRTEATEAALRGQTDTRIVRDYRGMRVLSSFAPLHIAGLRWVLLSEIDEKEAFRSVYELREQLILSGLLILLLAVSLGFLISQTIARPIRTLTDAAEQFGRGALDRRAVVRSQDEIGILAETFNTMADKIRFHTSRLEDEIGERRRAEERLQRSQEQFRNLSRHLQSVREEERKGVAREIHDELGQRLTSLKLHLALLQEDVPSRNGGTHQRFSAMLDDIDETIQSVKRIISQLRPGLLDDLGLSAAIEWQTEEFQRHSGIRCTLSISPPELSLDADRATAVFRIFQETLTNVARHAGADAVRIELCEDADTVHLTIRDDGRGIRPEEIEHPASFGLVGIRERAQYFDGDVTITGEPGGGTTVSVHIPTAAQERRQ
ncbi:MAG: histidine kinase, partial [Bacteroidota bacterium]|nr:histidine kinase [Bacteroidota bacterium]